MSGVESEKELALVVVKVNSNGLKCLSNILTTGQDGKDVICDSFSVRLQSGGTLLAYTYSKRHYAIYLHSRQIFGK